MKLRVLAAIAMVFSASLALSACATTSGEPGGAGSSSVAPGAVSTEEFLAAQNLEGLDSVAIIDRLDAMPLAKRPTDLMASVRPDALVLSDMTGSEVSLPMPEDEVYLSVAPYAVQTHDCYFHSLTTCVGEMSGVDVRVTLTTDSGEVLVDEVRRSFDNGFVGLWVPRGIQGTLAMSVDGKQGSTAISTMAADDPTCITTLQVA